MITRVLTLSLFAGSLLAGTPAAAGPGLSFGPALSDGAVLQQGQPIVVSGSAQPNAAVQVELGSLFGAATARDDGHWEVTLPPQNAIDGLSLAASVGAERIELHNLSVGDVVLCSGQSNMEFTMAQAAMNDNDRKQAIDRKIRLLTVPQGGARTEQTVFAKPATWREAFGQAQDFSAVCLFAGRELAKARGVTIGLVDSSLGSTVIESWLPLNGLRKVPALDKEAEIMAAFASNAPDAEARFGQQLDTLWKEIPAKAGNPGRSRMGYGNLFNAMIAPLGRAAFAGVIWYQGESNARNADSRSIYSDKLAALEASWRERFGKNLPFVIVQIAPFGALSGKVEESTWAEVREAQRLTVLHDPASALVVTSDVGERLFIHPPIKKPVGMRAGSALLALMSQGGKKQPGLSLGGVRRVGNAVLVSVEGANGGLIAASWGRPGPFELCRSGDRPDCRFADAAFTSTGVAIDVPRGFSPDRVRYCWGAAPICNVFDGTEQPLGPFEAAIVAH